MNELHTEVIDILNSIKELSQLHHESIKHSTVRVNATPISEIQQFIKALEAQLKQKLTNHQWILQFAIQSHQKHNLMTAEREYKRYLSLGNVNHVAYINLGVIAQSYQDFETAMTYYQASIEINPRYFKAQLNLWFVKAYNTLIDLFYFDHCLSAFFNRLNSCFLRSERIQGVHLVTVL